jgi:hypothetical protein
MRSADMNDPWHVDSENYRAAYYETIEKAKTELPSPLLAKLSNSGGSRIAGVILATASPVTDYGPGNLWQSPAPLWV